MFNENSIVARIWAEKVKDGTYTLEQVPDLYNLREVVAGMVV
ncbi:MAG: hypothetical protein ACI4DL_09605 [Lachnospiraceae bacterium]